MRLGQGESHSPTPPPALSNERCAVIVVGSGFAGGVAARRLAPGGLCDVRVLNDVLVGQSAGYVDGSLLYVEPDPSTGALLTPLGQCKRP